MDALDHAHARLADSVRAWLLCVALYTLMLTLLLGWPWLLFLSGLATIEHFRLRHMKRLILVLATLSTVAQAQAPPKQFTIHGVEWKLIQVKSIENGEQAQTRCEKHIVLIRSDIGTRQELAETILHEVLHALGCEGGEAHDERYNNSNDEADGCDGHCGLYWAGRELIAFIAENPELIRFLQESSERSRMGICHW